MKTLTKIIIAAVVALALFVALSFETVENPGYRDVFTGITKASDTTVVKSQINPETDATAHFRQRKITFSDVYPNESAICVVSSWIADAPKLYGKEISLHLTNKKSAQEEAYYLVRKVDALLNYKNDTERQTDELKKIDRQISYQKKWYQWRYYTGPSKSGNPKETGIYLEENVVCNNATWIKDLEAEEVEATTIIMTMNMQNIFFQYNSSEVMNETAFYSRNGTIFVQGPSRNGETGVGIYYKK